MNKRGRPQKPENLVKKRIVQIRILEVEKQAFEDAANLAGISLSAWIRERLRETARNELERIGKKVKFLS